MFEVDKLPPYWVRSLNTVDQVWTPSHWGAESFKNSGVKEDIIRVAPGGVDLDIFNPYRAPMVEKDDNFRFLIEGKWEIRKGVDLMVRAFCDEFERNEKVELMMDCTMVKSYIQNFNIYKELFELGIKA